MAQSETVEIKEFPTLIGGDEEISEYYFESDPLALKGNPDYQQLIKALVKLQAQRTKAVKDMERLQEAREEALKDPLKFVTALQNGDNLNLPAPQEITQIPHIDWEKYNVQSIMQGMRPKTRKRMHQENQTVQQQMLQDTKEFIGADGKVLVRGRVYDESKPQTFNQSWSNEEQRKLEELLMKYPDESISYHRWAKISKELGTRTPLQVQSRVQKYFIALKQRGLPVPGKNPRTAVMRKQYGCGRKRGGGLHSLGTGKVSLFMKAFNMYDDKFDLGEAGAGPSEISWDVSDEEDITEELRVSDEYQELLRLKQVRSFKVQEMDTGVISHPGFGCDMCGMDPILGPRWHCLECPAAVSVDLCEKCVKADFSTETHQTSHILKPIRALCIKDTMVGQN